jgi:8-oxo-dGTP diphosphatase
MSFTYEFERPALMVDAVIFGIDPGGRSLKVLLVERALEPFVHEWALPGGHVAEGETLEEAMRRELREETGLEGVYLEQLMTFGDPGRDPRGWVVSVAYMALVAPDRHALASGTDALSARWFETGDLPALAFDHAAILETAVARLRGKVTYAPIGFELLPKKFTLTQLQTMYEVILDRELDRRNFRKKVLGLKLLEELDEWTEGVSHRKARYYRFDERAYRRLRASGFSFSI